MTRAPFIYGHMADRQILKLDDTAYETTFTRKFAELRKPYIPPDPKRLKAAIPGVVLDLLVKPGDQVRRGQSLLVLEAMKMQNHVTAPEAGIVKGPHVHPGETVVKGQLLVEFE